MKDLFLIISNQIHDTITLCGENPSIYSFERQNKCLFNIKKNCKLLETIDIREHCQHDIITSSESWILYLLSIICPDKENIPFPELCSESGLEQDSSNSDEQCIDTCSETNHNPCTNPNYSYNPCPVYYPDFCPDYCKSKYDTVIIPTSKPCIVNSCQETEKKGSVKICRKKLDKLLELIKLENLARLSNHKLD